MQPTRSRLAYAAKASGLGLLSLAVVYLVAANLLISTGGLRRAINAAPDELFLEYASGYTLYPGHLRVKGLRLRFQDQNIRAALSIEAATVRLALRELARRKFHATEVRAVGVSWQMLHKVTRLEGQEGRIAAFPPIEGFVGPPILGPPPPALSQPREGLWTLQLDDIEAAVHEVWVLEYRYQGSGHASGAFAIERLQHVRVGPAALTLAPGSLSVGEHVASGDFGMRASCSIVGLDILAMRGLSAFRPITASVELDATLEGLGLIELYQPGFEAEGPGTLAADVQLVEGRLAKGSVVEARFPTVDLRSGRYRFDGTLNWRLGVVSNASGRPVVAAHGASEGSVRVAISTETAVTAAVTDTHADLELDTNDVAQGLALAWIHASVGEARVADAREISAAAGEELFIARAILGGGPLVAAGTLHLTPAGSLVRLASAELGGGHIAGAAAESGHGWRGAAAGQLGVIPIGLRLVNESVEATPFIGGGWLQAELTKAGIEPPRRHPSPTWARPSL